MEFIDLLSPEHFLYIGILIFFGLLLFMNQSFVREHRQLISKIILTLSILQQILLYGSYVWLGEFTLAESLPFHISRINSILGILFLVTQSQRLFNFVSYLSVFAWLSFLVPINIEPITHVRGVSFITNHVITLLLPFYGRIAYNLRIDRSYRIHVIKWFLIYFVFAIILNYFTGGNYFYLRVKPIIPNAPNIIYFPIAIAVSILLFYIIENIYRFTDKHLLEE